MAPGRDDESALVHFYRSLAPFDGITLRLFKTKENEYTAIGADSHRVAQLVYHTSGGLRRIGSEKLDSCSLNVTMFGTLLQRALQQFGLRVELYEQRQANKSAWFLARQATPGNLQEIEDLIPQSYDQKPLIVGVKLSGNAQSRTVGLCFLDTQAQTIGLCEFIDNDLFSNFEACIIQLGAKEAVISDDMSPETKKLRSLLHRLDILVTPRKNSYFAADNAEDSILRLTGNSRLDLVLQLEQRTALGAAAAVIDYLGLAQHQQDFGHYEMIQHNLQDFMRLDAAALKALNVLPSSRDGSRTMSLYGLLNNCKTLAGQRKLGQWLKQPLMNIKDIEKRHNLVEVFFNDSVTRAKFQNDNFAVVPDISRIARKFHAGKARLADVVRLYLLVIKLPEFLADLQEIPSSLVEELWVDPLRGSSKELAKLTELVETTIDLTALQRHEYLVNPNFDDQLKDIRSELTQLEGKIDEHLADAREDLDTPKVTIEDNKQYGRCFRVVRSSAGLLRGQKKYIELGLNKQGQYFTTRVLRELVDDYSQLKQQYDKTQSSLANEITNVASTYIPVLLPLGEILAEIDVIVSFAHTSAFAKLPYIRPKMSTDGPIVLKQARHPCMEAQDDMLFIPNDVTMEHGNSEFAIITGPNMGGKSTYIRQIGVIAHMAQVGCFVPCDEAELPIIDCILARVGAGDSQLKGLSTFMSEMIETAGILKAATPKSLIIIDELGRGTSTYDGFGLAWAISQHIVTHIGCFTMFATHFHELTALSQKHPQVTNLHVAATARDDEDITLLYQVKPGISDKSFGIHVAEVVHFPEKVVRMAKRKAHELEALDANENVEEVTAGTEILRSILRQWSATADMSRPGEASQELRKCLDSHREELNKHSFLKELFVSL